MKSIDKLRESLKDCIKEAGIEPNKFDTYWITSDACDHLIDEIEAEIADNYIELPVDVNGVPIHVGDICEMSDDRFEVRQLKTDGDCWWAVGRLGDPYPVWKCRHVKPRTLEDVLRSYACDFADSSGPDYDEEITRKYADEIRELLLGGDAE